MYKDVTSERHYETKGISGNRFSCLSILRNIRNCKKSKRLHGSFPDNSESSLNYTPFMAKKNSSTFQKPIHDLFMETNFFCLRREERNSNTPSKVILPGLIVLSKYYFNNNY